MADDEDQSSKTEEASQHKLEKLREDGKVPQSREVTHLFMLIGMVVLAGGLASFSFGRLSELGAAILNSAGTTTLDSPSAVGAILADVGGNALLAMLPLFALFMVLGVAGGWVQHGGIFAPKAIAPNLQKISPLAGFKRIFGLQAVAELIKSLLKLGILGAVLGNLIYESRDVIVALVDETGPSGLVHKLHYLIIKLVAAATIIMLVLALADYLFQRFKFLHENMMSLREVKDEMRDNEGDQYVKQRQRQIRNDRARTRMMQAVPKADVVVTNPTHYAVALRYKPEEGDAAPVVLAKGVEAVALRIREVATEHDIPLYEDPPLARLLFAQAEIDEPIPLQTYELVARVMAFVADLRARKRRTA
jgi:flagellar biosynthetic protein FlhB